MNVSRVRLKLYEKFGDAIVLFPAELKLLPLPTSRVCKFDENHVFVPRDINHMFCSKRCFYTYKNSDYVIRKRLYEKLWALDDGCVIWIGVVDKAGYGVFHINNTNKPAPVVAWELEFGKVPKGLCVCHNCPTGDDPRCCAIPHLWLGTHQENMQDRDRKGRQNKGVGVWNARMNEAKVRQGRSMWNSGKFLKQEIADFFGISGSSMGKILNGQNWRHIQ